MNIYETSATVEEQGQVRLVGVPFEPGTRVEVTIRETASADANAETANLDAARAHEGFVRARAGTQHGAGWAATTRGSV